jgi:hypothetical protein
MRRKFLIIGFLLAIFLLPLSIRLLISFNQKDLPGNTDSLEADRFVKVHTDRVNNFIKEIQTESLEESFANLINDQQYSYPSYHSNIKGAPKDMEMLLSSRRFLKVLQQFQSLSLKQANTLLDKFCKEAIDEYRIAVLDTRNPKTASSVISDPDPNPKTSKPHSLMGAKYMICASMLLAAHISNCQKIWEQFEKMNQIIQEEKIYIEENKDTELGRILISIMSLDRGCIVCVFTYAMTQAKNNSEPVIALKAKLDKKEIPLVKWNASETYYDVLHKSGYRQIEKKTIVQNFIVYSIPRNRNDNNVGYDDIVKLFKSELNTKHK